MRVLHVSSDWKWTGCSEPMLRLLLAQRARGDEAALACPEDPEGHAPSVAERARAAGVEPICTLAPLRGARWWRDAEDAVRLIIKTVKQGEREQAKARAAGSPSAY